MKGTWAESLLESALKALLSHARSQHQEFDFGASSVITQSKQHVKTLEHMKKNFKVL